MHAKVIQYSVFVLLAYKVNCNTVIQSWQDENIKQTQNSLWRSPKPSNTLPHPINKTTTMAAANSVGMNTIQQDSVDTKPEI